MFDLQAALGKLDRRVSILQHTLVGMEHAAEGPIAEDITALCELAQEIREAVTMLRIETDGYRLVGGSR